MENLVVVPVILRTDLSGSLHFHLREMLLQQKDPYYLHPITTTSRLSIDPFATI